MEKDFVRPLLLDHARAWRTYQGGKLLDEFLGFADPKDSHFPEEWIASTVCARNAGRENLLHEGLSSLDGQHRLLKELIEESPKEMLGKSHVKAIGQQMGVLIKLIDSSERLSIQVHPDKQKARELFASSFGKTECWHILGGRSIDGEEPSIYLGFKPGVTRAYWEELFHKQDIPAMRGAMHRFSVQKGDTFLLEGGTPHAIGAGCFLAEIQEPTDYTIRVERTTVSGLPINDAMCHQGLGFERMFDCFHYQGLTKEEAGARWKIPPQQLEKTAEGETIEIIGYRQTTCFAMEKIVCKGKMTLPQEERFSVLYTIGGAGRFTCGGEQFPFVHGQQWFLPAMVGAVEIICESEQPVELFYCHGPQV